MTRTSLEMQIVWTCLCRGPAVDKGSGLERGEVLTGMSMANLDNGSVVLGAGLLLGVSDIYIRTRPRGPANGSTSDRLFFERCLDLVSPDLASVPRPLHDKPLISCPRIASQTR